jgi:hypothetical protein
MASRKRIPPGLLDPESQAIEEAIAGSPAVAQFGQGVYNFGQNLATSAVDLGKRFSQDPYGTVRGGILGAYDVGRAFAQNPREMMTKMAQAEMQRVSQALQSPQAAGEYLPSFLNPAKILKAASNKPMRGILDEPEDYRGQHKAPTLSAASADDLTKNEIYPSDVYSRPDWYEYGDGLREIRKIQQLRGNPDASVTIYRAVPKDVQANAGKLKINPGDWVTTNKKYAKQHGESNLTGEYRILSKTVKARDIFTNGDSIFEWGYNPSGE